jgi:hypothetical protein
MKKCSHKNVYIDKEDGRYNMTHGYFILSRYHSVEIPGHNSKITTWCADCGEKVKEVELKDYIK